MACRLKLLMSSGSKKKVSRYTCLSETKASHSQRIWAEVSSPAPHLLCKGLLVSPIKCRYHLRVLHPVRRLIKTLDFVLLEDKNLVFATRLGKSVLEPVFEYYQDLTTLPNADYRSSILFFFLYSA